MRTLLFFRLRTATLLVSLSYARETTHRPFPQGPDACKVNRLHLCTLSLIEIPFFSIGIGCNSQLNANRSYTITKLHLENLENNNFWVFFNVSSQHSKTSGNFFKETMHFLPCSSWKSNCCHFQRTHC